MADILATSEGVVTVDGQIATDSCENQCCVPGPPCASQRWRRLLANGDAACGELWVCVDSTDANGVRLDEVDDGWYVTLSNGQGGDPALEPNQRCYLTTNEYRTTDGEGPFIFTASPNELPICNRWVRSVACPGADSVDSAPPLVWFDARAICDSCYLYELGYNNLPSSENWCVTVKPPQPGVFSTDYDSIPDDDWVDLGGQLYRKGDTVNPQPRGQVIRRVDSGQCCDCMPGCERSTPDVVGGCFGDPSIRECCCNERSYTSTYAETHDFKRWTYFETDVIPAPRELIEEYTESVVQLGVRQVVDNTIVIDQPCIARRIGREYNGTDEFGNRLYYEYDIMVEYSPPSWGCPAPEFIQANDNISFRIAAFCPEKFRPAPYQTVKWGSTQETSGVPGDTDTGWVAVSGGEDAECTQSNLNLTLGVYTPVTSQLGGGVLEASETIRKAFTFVSDGSRCNGGCPSGSSAIVLASGGQTGVPVLDQLLGAP